MTVMLKCGCRSSSTVTASDGKRYPYCPIHDCGEIAAAPPDLEGRVAVCGYGCGHQRPSSLDLAFFQSRPERETDSYYCGCRGWD
jgi:hypothetical protein